MKRGNRAAFPARFSFFEPAQFFNAAAKFASPPAYASLLLHAHQGATSLLAWFQSRRSPEADQFRHRVSWSSGTPYDRSAARWDRFALTRARVGLDLLDLPFPVDELALLPGRAALLP